MFLHTYVNNWSSALTLAINSTDNNLYIPQADIDLLPDITADGPMSIPMVLDDGAGTYEIIAAYQKYTGYIKVTRDIFAIHAPNPSWPIGSQLYCRPFAEMTRFTNQSYLTRVALSPGGSQYVAPKDPSSRSYLLTISQDITITFNTSTVSAYIFDRTSRFTLILKQDATGGHAITFVANLLWDGGTQPTLDTTADSYVVIDFYEVANDYWVASVVANGAI